MKRCTFQTINTTLYTPPHCIPNTPSPSNQSDSKFPHFDKKKSNILSRPYINPPCPSQHKITQSNYRFDSTIRQPPPRPHWIGESKSIKLPAKSTSHFASPFPPPAKPMAAASVSTAFRPLCKPNKDFKSFVPFTQTPKFLTKTKHHSSLKAVGKEQDVIPVQSNDLTDHQVGSLVSEIEREVDGGKEVQLIGGFGGTERRLSFEGGFSSATSSGGGGNGPQVVEAENLDKLIDRIINATIVLAAGTFGITKLLTIDYDYWHGWTIYEILRYAPQHNWSAYEEALKENPLLAKMMISGVVYSIGDWIAQCCEGKPLLEFDRSRMFRSGLVGFTLHGSLSHYYYYFCEALFPFQDWWVVPVKVVFDQTAWAAVWNSIYFVVVGLLRFDSSYAIFSELKSTFWPMLTAGWKLWPFAHIITYGVIPVEQRLLWVDCVELIWVTILSTLSNEKSEARISDVPVEVNSSSSFEPTEEQRPM